jgi:hypothetical protein
MAICVCYERSEALNLSITVDGNMFYFIGAAIIRQLLESQYG